MAQAKNAKTLSVHVPQALIEEIDRRAKILKWSRSKYAAELLMRWYNEGARPVHPSEPYVHHPSEPAQAAEHGPPYLEQPVTSQLPPAHELEAALKSFHPPGPIEPFEPREHRDPDVREKNEPTPGHHGPIPALPGGPSQEPTA